MNFNYKLNLKDLIGNNYNNYSKYGIILTENSPHIVWEANKYKRPSATFLWYPIELGPIPNTFTEYFEEKLAVTNKSTALNIIREWNTKPIPTVYIINSFNIGQKRFATIKDPKKENQVIVLCGFADRPQHMRTCQAGRGGYAWQRLGKSKLLNNAFTHGDLRLRFGLRYKVDRDRFIKKWNNIYR